MNNKHIACALVALVIVVLIQVTLSVHNARTKVQNEASTAMNGEIAATQQLALANAQLAELQRQSKSTIEFLQLWQPYFSVINNPQSAEVVFNLKVKNSNLVNLAQRFEQTPIVNNSSIPSAMRAYLTFEDDYAALLNWVGAVERDMPTARINSINLTKGTRANDLRMELVLEQPLMKQ